MSLPSRVPPANMSAVMTPKDTMERYFESWNARDFDAFEARLAPDVDFAGPLGTAPGPAGCRPGPRAGRMPRRHRGPVADGRAGGGRRDGGRRGRRDHVVRAPHPGRRRAP